jgi:2,3-bisphosphoglycerate-dependent phosphoglycerate mutase
MGKLILVRHGHTALNVPGKDERLRGWLDLPLDNQGLQEAADLAKRLADYPVEVIYSSDLRRARQTAELLRRRHTQAPPHSSAAGHNYPRTTTVESGSIRRPESF